MTTLNVQERTRRNRNIVFTAFVVLLFIWTVKLSFPQETVLSLYNPPTVDNLSSSSPPAQQGHGPSSVSGSRTSSISSSSSTTTKHYKPTPTATEIYNPQLGVGVDSGDDTFNGTIANKAAVIIETRYRTNLIPLILHFSTVLGPSWPILIYTSVESVGLFASSAALSRYLRSGLIQLRILPSTVLFTNSNSVNKFMTDRWIWENLAPVENVLIFQSDSMLCANAARSVDDFFAYDFVGAPIKDGLGKGYNGGLSLRKRSSTLRVLDEWEWATTGALEEKGGRFEDQWYYARFESPSISLPSFPTALYTNLHFYID